MGESAIQIAERRAQCGAQERPDGERASRWGEPNTANSLGQMCSDIFTCAKQIFALVFAYGYNEKGLLT